MAVRYKVVDLREPAELTGPVYADRLADVRTILEALGPGEYRVTRQAQVAGRWTRDGGRRADEVIRTEGTRPW